MQKELSVEEKLAKLYELQLIDSQIDEIQVLKGELPMEVEDLRDEITGLETRVSKLKSQIEGVESEISRYNTTVKEDEANVQKYKKQLDTIKNDREYTALSKQIVDAGLDIELAKKRGSEAQRSLVGKQETLVAADQRLAQRRKDLATKEEELNRILERTSAEENRLQKESLGKQKFIEDRLLKSYKKIRAAYRNGLAVVTIQRESCGGCFNRIPPQLQIEIALHKKIIACEHCGRVIVEESITREAVGAE
jgi:predicted  nucleic acid-binding Zn-ribbon protein